MSGPTGTCTGITFLSENLWWDSTQTLTTGTEHAQFPLVNLDNESPSNKFRSLGNTAVIEVDLTVTRTIDTIAVLGDQTETLGITSMSVKFSNTNDFTMSPSIPITLSSEYAMGWEYVTEIDARFVEITLTGNGSYAEVSNFFIGERLNLPQNSISIGSFSYGYKDNSSIRSNKFGQKFIDERNLQKRLGGQIQYCTKEEQEELDNMFRRHGKHEPLWMILDSESSAINDGKYKLTIYGYITQDPSWSADGGQLYSTRISVEEAI